MSTADNHLVSSADNHLVSSADNHLVSSADNHLVSSADNHLVSFADNLSNQLGPDQARQYVQPYLITNCLAFRWLSRKY